MLPHSFERNSRRQHELAMRPVIDVIYRSTWPGCTIRRYEREEDIVLDKKHGIDVEVTLPTGMILLGQEKALTYQWRRKRTVTVEYHQNPATGEKGDWFHLAPQFYFCGYANSDKSGFAPWVLLDWAQLALQTNAKHISWQGPIPNSNSPARADFKAVVMDTLPPACIIASNGLKLQQTTMPIKSDRQHVKELIVNMTLAEVRDIIGEVLTEKIAKAA